MMLDNKLFRELFLLKYEKEYVSGVFSDELDKLGYKNQVINGWNLNNSGGRLFGKVRTLELETIETDNEEIQKGLGFLAGLSASEVFVVSGSSEYAYFGELMSRLSQEVGIEGVVIDGLTRDTFYTRNIELPVFSKGYTPKDIKGRGRVGHTDREIRIDSVQVRSGDYIFGDNDALVVIPKEIMSDLAKKVNMAVEEEAEIKSKIDQGKTIQEILLNHKSF